MTTPANPYELHNANTLDSQLTGAMGYFGLKGSSEADNHQASPSERLLSEDAFKDYLDHLSTVVAEVAVESERIARGASLLIETFGVTPEFFEDSNRSTIFASLALSAAKVQEAAGRHEDPHELSRKQGFIANATFLLTRKYTTRYQDLSADHEAQVNAGRSKVTKASWDKFEQPELSAALSSYIDRHGILDRLKARFGSDGMLPQYHVLSIGQQPSFHFDLKKNGISWPEAKAWDNGIAARTQTVAKTIPDGELLSKSSGFAVTFDGQTHVYLPAPAAELLMAEERGIVPNQYMIDTDRAERTKGTIRHEFTHTKGSVLVSNEFGRSLEERRAEYFAGDSGEYFEVKGFFRQLQLLHGDFIGDLFEQALDSKHTDTPVNIYELIGKHFGMEEVAEIAASQPNAYVNHTKSSFTKNMLASLGGYAAIIERIAVSDNVDQEAARTRVRQYINKLRANNGAAENGLDEDYEEFLGGFLSPILHGLKMELADIVFEPPKQ